MQYEVTVGMPSFRTPPSGFGISTLRTGDGVYFLLSIRLINSCCCSFRYGRASSVVISSIPAAPLFAFTLLYALLRLSLCRIASKSSGCALSLSTPTDSVLHLSATLTSADFCVLSDIYQCRLLLSEHSTQTSLGTTRFFSSIYPSSLPQTIPCSY